MDEPGSPKRRVQSVLFMCNYNAVRSLAAEAIGRVAAELGLTAQDCAAGVLEIFAWNQANALRRITTGRGLDVRDFPLVTFGGSGSLLACRLLDLLGQSADARELAAIGTRIAPNTELPKPEGVFPRYQVE